MTRKKAGATEVGTDFPAGFVAQALSRLATQGASAECIAYVREAMDGPSRNTASGPRHMSGRFPSRKVGVSLGFESLTLESSAARRMEHDDKVWLFLDQAPKLKLTYKINGRNRGYYVTPDLIAARDDGVVLVECKRLAVVQKDAASHPELYVQRDGRWACPPAEAEAQRMGMRFELWTENDFTYCGVANAQFLDDYLRESVEIPGYESARVAIQQLLGVKKRSTITELLATLRLQGVLPDHVHLAIARGDVAVDLEAVPVRLHDVCMVFPDRLTMAAFSACERTKAHDNPRVPALCLQVGAQVLWDRVPWTVLNVGAQLVSLHSGQQHQSLPLSLIKDLARDGVMESLATAAPDEKELAASNRLLAASEGDLMEAHRRLELIEPWLNGTMSGPRNRSIGRYLADYKTAQQQLGNGFVGLIRKTSKSGNRASRLRSDVLALVTAEVNERFLKSTQINRHILYGHIADRCRAEALPTPSYAWLCKFIKRLPPDLVARARSGDKVAYGLEPRVESTDLASAMEPVRPFERAHIDHTLLDLESIADQAWMGLGRVWITLMIDHYSRRVLGLYLTYAAPSYASVMGVMRDCVRRFGRLPDAIVVDGGKEFRSVWFETTCAWYHVVIIRRPPAKPRFGAQIERYFGTLNTTLIYNLAGNTQNTKNVRQLTAEIAPSRHAIWTFSALHDLLEEYIFDTYDTLPHRELAMAPREQFAMGMATAGHRPQRFIADDLTFRILTCPSTKKGTAKVTLDGVKINYLYYQAPELGKHLGKSVRVRYDSDNMAIAYAHVGGAWVRLRARHQAHLRFVSEHYIKLLTDEWRKRRSAVEKERLTDTALIKFLLEVQKTETLLKERKQEAEERARREMSRTETDTDTDMDTVEPESPEADERGVESASQATSDLGQVASTPDARDEDIETLEIY